MTVQLPLNIIFEIYIDIILNSKVINGLNIEGSTGRNAW